MADTCVRHSFELAKGVCRQCHNSFCEECLVYSFGPKKPPFCIACALQAAGVRRTGNKHNPKVKRSGFFGRLKAVEEPVKRERTFDEIDIGLPPMAESAPAASYRRSASPELVEVVAAGEAAGAAPAPVEVFPDTEPQVSAEEGSLADWAASLGTPGGASTSKPSASDWPETDIAPWPGGDSGGSSF